MAESRRFVAVLRRTDGTLTEVSDYAASFAIAETLVRRLYVLGGKNEADPFRLKGASVERIEFDEYADVLWKRTKVNDD